ncbi:HAD family hydrolase [Herminiimonas sp.]|uniref:HAD family hydrolase n=1 Tax=Herminiimonas sp. TaxID=1926289 RepID=UPI00272906E5|nr:HAD-IA family hydrolase [Herminiimonas sp.]MDO8304195.1 HAD-IA family hydrolase [Herminiimonas sp.]
MKLRTPLAILFDLDGTLADTAPDLAGAVNQLRIARGLAPTDYELLRPIASAGARGLIGVAFGITPDDAAYEELRDDFLKNYEAAIAVDSSLFAGITELLSGLQEQGIAWGIVTNKIARLTDQLVPKIGLGHAACVISGDTTAHSKPHPAPLFEAAKRIGVLPEHCWYVGDDLRDIQAGQAAGMTTIAAAWGYCGEAAPATWNADVLVDTPQQLFALLGK